MISTAGASLSRAGQIAARAVAAAYVLVGAFPELSPPGTPSLDGSWVLAINELAERGFGDVVFTYGPLGYLLYPAPVANHLGAAALLRLVVVALLAAFTFFSTAHWWIVALFGFAQVAAVGSGLVFEYQAMILLVLIAAGGAHLGVAGVLSRLGAVAAVAVVGLFVKFSLGVALVLAAATACMLHARHRRTALLVAWPAVAGVAALLATSAALLGSPAAAAPWLERSLDMAASYSEVMSLRITVGGADVFAGLGVAALVFLAVSGAWLWRRGSPAAMVLLVGAGPAFVAFKHAFVRQDSGHAAVFFPFMLALVGGAALLARARAERLALATTAFAVLVLALSVKSVYGEADPKWLPESGLASDIVGWRGLRALGTWLSPGARKAALSRDLSADAIPGLDAYAAGRRVAVVPSELAMCQASGISCQANPTLQTFAAYTPDLDRWSAAHFEGTGAPDVVLLEPRGFDERVPAFDTPALWRTLAWGYRVAPFQGGRALVIERAVREPLPPLHEFGGVELAPERWVPVPGLPAPLYAAIALDLAPSGKWMRTVFRVPPVHIALLHDDGRVERIRLVPPTASEGLPLDQLPRSAQDLLQVFRGGTAQRPVAIAIGGQGLRFYRAPVMLRWLVARAPP